MSEDEKMPPSEGDDEFEIGYCKPPKHTRFKPGQSGNPKGRPKGSKNLATDLREELNEKVPIREDGKVKKVSKQRAFLKALVAKAMSGDTRAGQAVINMAAAFLIEDPDDSNSTPLSSEDKEIIKFYNQRVRAADNE